MRFVAAFTGALIITVSVFIFMQKLIENRQNASQGLPVYEPIEIVQQRTTRQQPEPPLQEQTEPEPVIEQLQIPLPSPQPAVEMELPAFDLSVGDLEIQTGQGRWNTPLSADTVNILEGTGVNAQAYVEVVPIGTRMPNVPELAWKNKINGWVLVAFNVLPNGRTSNIRVLDANPRGIFEEKVIAAVEDWLYSVQYFGELKGEIILTQKVEVRWENYSSNFLQLDR